jgi:hypothetical protein
MPDRWNKQASRINWKKFDRFTLIRFYNIAYPMSTISNNPIASTIILDALFLGSFIIEIGVLDGCQT